MRIRIRFGKHGAMKFVGHLDLMRYFQKAMRRAQVPIKFSQGYHPHPIMSFAEPLGLGITSDGEYMDIETEEDVSGPALIDALQATMVDGMRIHSVRRLPDQAKNAMASVAASVYRLTYQKGEAPAPISTLLAARQTFYDLATSIPMVKKTKKSERTLDLKPLIYAWQIEPFPGDGAEEKTCVEGEDAKWSFPIDPSDGEDGPICHRIILSSGSTDNIKPTLVMDRFHSFLAVDPEDYPIRVYREDILTKLDQDLVSLDQVGLEMP